MCLPRSPGENSFRQCASTLRARFHQRPPVNASFPNEFKGLIRRDGAGHATNGESEATMKIFSYEKAIGYGYYTGVAGLSDQRMRAVVIAER